MRIVAAEARVDHVAQALAQGEHAARGGNERDERDDETASDTARGSASKLGEVPDLAFRRGRSSHHNPMLAKNSSTTGRQIAMPPTNS